MAILISSIAMQRLIMLPTALASDTVYSETSTPAEKHPGPGLIKGKSVLLEKQ